ncbi:uncharacterized protein LOC134764342 [Penaeus indicus]|uniref:uncharacterized protein LOC134764342 n=1 Tax=Penaeus indicus TaxID=29960 RepID=UPI00300C2FA1
MSLRGRASAAPRFLREHVCRVSFAIPSPSRRGFSGGAASGVTTGDPYECAEAFEMVNKKRFRIPIDVCFFLERKCTLSGSLAPHSSVSLILPSANSYHVVQDLDLLADSKHSFRCGSSTGYHPLTSIFFSCLGVQPEMRQETHRWKLQDQLVLQVLRKLTVNRRQRTKPRYLHLLHDEINKD